MMWKHSAINEHKCFSLHDCFISSARIENESICAKGLRLGEYCLVFDDGFWVLPNTPYHQSPDMIRTGKAEVHIQGEVDVDCDVTLHAPVRLFNQTILTLLDSMTLKKWTDDVNSAKQCYEIIKTYHDDTTMLIHGAVHSRRAAIGKTQERFEVCISSVKIMQVVYSWDVLRPDCTW